MGSERRIAARRVSDHATCRSDFAFNRVLGLSRSASDFHSEIPLTCSIVSLLLPKDFEFVRVELRPVLLGAPGTGKVDHTSNSTLIVVPSVR